MMRIANNKLRLLLLLLFPTLLWGNSAPMFHIRQNAKGCFVEIPKGGWERAAGVATEVCYWQFSS